MGNYDYKDFTKNAVVPSRQLLDSMAKAGDKRFQHAYLQFKHTAYPRMMKEGENVERRSEGEGVEGY